MNELINMDIAQISYGALFVWLLFYTIKNNEKRENAINERNEKREQMYQSTIYDLSDKLNVVYTINEKLDKMEVKNE